MSKSRVADVIPKIQINMDNWRALSIVQAASIVVGFTAWARNYKMLLKELKNKTSGSALEQPGVVDCCWFQMHRQSRFNDDDQKLVDDRVGFYHNRCYTLAAEKEQREKERRRACKESED
ncbi:MAG: hypothetical protein L6R41_002276 [Letrouitia leprolyta]|nr:MAG: hypothetical protein L6R41_002276 [Letrouitia leprolyta]